MAKLKHCEEDIVRKTALERVQLAEKNQPLIARLKVVAIREAMNPSLASSSCRACSSIAVAPIEEGPRDSSALRRDR